MKRSRRNTAIDTPFSPDEPATGETSSPVAAPAAPKSIHPVGKAGPNRAQREMPPAVTTTRFDSVDVLRGFTVIVMLVVNNPGDWNHVYAPLAHTKWNGCSLADLVFPVFLFLVGVSINLYNATARQRQIAIADRHKRILLRSIKLVIAGLLLSGAMTLAFHVPHFLVMGTLQRIGVCYLLTALAALYLSTRMQWVATITLLVGYSLLLHAGGSYEPFTNISDRLDNLVLGVHAAVTDPATGTHRDADGLLSTCGALVTTLVGLRAGDWLRGGKTRYLLLFGALALIAGYALSPVVPINKKMWTASFVFWTAGWSLLGLGLAHVLIDRWKWPALARAVGLNAVGAYMGSLLIFFALYWLHWWKPIYQTVFASWIVPIAGPYVSSLSYAITFAALSWLVLKVLDRRGWYLRF